MGHTFSDVLIHAVFSTKHRRPAITPEIEARMHAYIGGILRAERCSLLAIGGMPDHLHLLVLLHPGVAIAGAMRVVKSRSSGWVHQTFADSPDFDWQDGYGAFSVSQSQRASVARYIERQAEHHRSRDFREEVLELLRRHRVEFDERYVFD